MWPNNRCRAVSTKAEGSNGVGHNWAAGEGGSLLIVALQAFEGDGVTTARRGFVITTLDSHLVSTSVGISGVGSREDGTG